MNIKIIQMYFDISKLSKCILTYQNYPNVFFMGELDPPDVP